MRFIGDLFPNQARVLGQSCGLDKQKKMNLSNTLKQLMKELMKIDIEDHFLTMYHCKVQRIGVTLDGF